MPQWMVSMLLGLAVMLPAARAGAAEDETTSVVKEIRDIRRRLGMEIMKSAVWQGSGNRGARFEDVLRGLVTSEKSAESSPDAPVRTSREARFARVLRRASLELDLRAAGLELTRRFRQADRLRRLAAQLRREARHAEAEP